MAKCRFPCVRFKQAGPKLPPDLWVSPTRSRELASALTELANDGVLGLPSGAWDRSTVPALPLSVKIPNARRAGSPRRWTQFPWCAELGWAASLPKLSSTQFSNLVAVYNWLARTRGDVVPIVPIRCSSSVTRSGWNMSCTPQRCSGPDYSTWTFWPAGAFHPQWQRPKSDQDPTCSSSRTAIPTWTAIEVLRNHPTAHPVGAVAWGCGTSFLAQVPTLALDIAGRGPVTGTVWYWGDLDPEGLAIATNAATASAEIKGPPIRAAKQLWAAMANQPVQSPGTITLSDIGSEWLGQELHAKLSTVRSAGGRVAQEAVPQAVIGEWVATIDQ